MADDDDGLRLRQVTDVAANHSEIDFACGERVGGLKRRPAVNDLEPHRRIRRNELACERRHCLGGLAVDRAHCHGQRDRTSVVPVGKETRACRKKADTDKQKKAKPNRKRSEEHTSELQSLTNLVCRLLLEKKKE